MRPSEPSPERGTDGTVFQGLQVTGDPSGRPAGYEEDVKIQFATKVSRKGS